MATITDQRDLQSVPNNEPENQEEPESPERTFSTFSNTTDDFLANYGVLTSYKKHQRRLPRPLKFTRTFRPKLLTPLQEQMLVNRLTKIPVWKIEGYGEELRRKELYRPKSMSQIAVDRMVERLTTPGKEQEASEDVEHKDESIFWYPEEVKEWRLSKNELNRLIDRLSCVKVRQPSPEPQKERKTLTSFAIGKLTARLNRPKVYQDDEKLPQIKENDVRFAGNKRMKKAEVEKLVERISFKGMKSITKEEMKYREERGKWSSWTPQDADYNQWKKTIKTSNANI